MRVLGPCQNTKFSLAASHLAPHMHMIESFFNTYLLYTSWTSGLAREPSRVPSSLAPAGPLNPIASPGIRSGLGASVEEETMGSMGQLGCFTLAYMGRHIMIFDGRL